MTHAEDMYVDNEPVPAPLPDPPSEVESRPRRTVESLAQRVGCQVLYLIGGYVLDVVAFAAVISILAVGMGTIVLWVGAPLLAAGMLLAGGFAAVQRRRVALATGEEIPHPNYRQPQPGAGAFQRTLTVLRDQQRWFEVLWTQVNFVVSTITFTIGSVWLLGAASVIVSPVFNLMVRSNKDFNGPGDLIGIHSWYGKTVVDLAIGMLFLVTLPVVMNLLTQARTMVSMAMLGTRPGYEQQLTSLRDSRSAVQQAEAASLRRLEQDIHDGPQQRLIRLQLDLSRAERAASTDPDRAAQILAGARAQTQETLAELRNLSRGIAPPVLVDRGLDAALDELAARSVVPAVVQGSAGVVPDHVATAAYFVAAEALTNANKHSGARQVRIRVGHEPGLLRVTISDDGVGGASLAKGHGLAGLAERLRGVDGELQVDSPVGGPTIVAATIPMVGTEAPCGSCSRMTRSSCDRGFDSWWRRRGMRWWLRWRTAMPWWTARLRFGPIC